MTNCVDLKHNCNSLSIKENIQLCVLPLKAKHNFYLFIKFPSLKDWARHRMTRPNLAFQWTKYKLTLFSYELGYWAQVQSFLI